MQPTSNVSHISMLSEFECPICLVHLNPKDTAEGSRIKFLECTHKFHELCINSWFYTLSKKDLEPFCPCCMSTLKQLRMSQILREDASASLVENAVQFSDIHDTASSTSIPSESADSFSPKPTLIDRNVTHLRSPVRSPVRFQNMPDPEGPISCNRCTLL